MLPDVSSPLWIICEDGAEYFERFSRFLDGEFRFLPAGDAASLVLLVELGAQEALAASIAGREGSASGDVAGVILDLDFRRTAAERLVDEQGRTHAAVAEETRQRLSQAQGILILRLLRARGFGVPVLLFADLDEDQAAYLERTLAPVAIVPSHEGLLQTAARMRKAGEGR
jgi:hypothetical protein